MRHRNSAHTTPHTIIMLWINDTQIKQIKLKILKQQCAGHAMNGLIFCLPGTGPQTRGMISRMAEHDGSSKHSWRARMQFRIDSVDLTLEPVTFTLNQMLKQY